jgi:hypothetical protein
MTRFLFALILFSGAIQAADPHFTFLVKDGRYFLVTFENGIPVNHPVNIRFVPFDGPEPEPEPSPDLTERSKAIRDSALKATSDPSRATTAQELAILYSEVGKKVTAGDIKGQANISAVIKGAADMLLSQKGATVVEAWKPMRNTLSDQWVKLAQETDKDAEFVKLLNETSSGLKASVPKALLLKFAEAQAISIEMIMKIIQLIMEILKLIPQGGGL